ncbi:hypothetical protein SALBM311S_03759 [Streptomyces alboniger]
MALAMLLPVAWTGSAGAQVAPSDGNHVVYQESAPTSATPTLAKDFKPAAPLTSQQQQAMQDALFKKRQRMAGLSARPIAGRVTSPRSAFRGLAR